MAPETIPTIASTRVTTPIAPATLPAGTGCKILLVEDDPIILAAVKRLLYLE